jgi:acyl-CoA synthetase (AMP-forming)/AMP-acid ligase II
MHDAVKTHPTFASRDLSRVPDLTGANPPPGSPLYHNSLGMTETGGPHTACPPELYGHQLPVALQGSFGFPLPYVAHRVVDPDTGEVLPEGEHGELCVRGYNLMDAMYKRERHEVFDDDGWYHTNDGGFFREGCFIFTGRLGEMIRPRRQRVTARGRSRAEDLPGVELAQVVGLPDEERGEIVAAVLVAEPGHDLDVSSVVGEPTSASRATRCPDVAVVAGRHPRLATTKVDCRSLPGGSPPVSCPAPTPVERR